MLPAITFSSDGRYEDQEQLVLTLTSCYQIVWALLLILSSKKILINNGAADVAPTVSITTATGTSAEGNC